MKIYLTSSFLTYETNKETLNDYKEKLIKIGFTNIEMEKNWKSNSVIVFNIDSLQDLIKIANVLDEQLILEPINENELDIQVYDFYIE